MVPSEIDLVERKWLYLDGNGAQKGPVAASLLLRLLEKGIGTTLNSMVWCPGLPSWQPIAATEPFTSTCILYAQQWYYLEQDPDSDETAQKGPILTQMLLHKLSEGTIDGLTLVISNTMTKWEKISDLPLLKEAMRKIAEAEEEAEMRAANILDATNEEMMTYNDEQPSFPLPSDATSDSDSATAPATTIKELSQQDNSNPHPAISTAHTAPKTNHKKKSSNSGGVARQHNWVYITGLTPDTTVDEVHAHFSKVGLIALNPLTQEAKIKLYYDDAGRVKGDCSLCYVAPQSADMAVSILSEGYIRPNCMVVVSRAEFESLQESGHGTDGSAHTGKKSKALSDAAEANAAKKSRVQNIKKGPTGPTAAQLKTAYAATKQALSWSEDDDTGVHSGLSTALKIVVIEGFFLPIEFLSNDDSYETALEDRIATQCEKYGEIEKITVFSKNPLGPTIVKFSTAHAAEQCIKCTNGQLYTPLPASASASANASINKSAATADATRRLKAYYWDGSTNFDVFGMPAKGNTSSEQYASGLGGGGDSDDEEKRLDEFGSWLEDQDDLPEEFTLRQE